MAIQANARDLQQLGDLQFPKSIDINPTAACNLNCSFCWGPDHSIPDGLSNEDWTNLLQFFKERGTDAVVFTGGETLLRKDLGQLVRFAKSLDLRVTLSTNTLLLGRYAKDILPFIDEIGIPLDGSTPERNRLMRLGNPRSFACVMEALAMIKRDYAHIEVTVRTVVSRVNKDDIPKIGPVLRERIGQFDRWKLYQFAPLSIGAAHEEEHGISLSDFSARTEAVRDLFPDLNLVFYPYNQRSGKYVFIDPQGVIFGDDPLSFGHKIVGNFLHSNAEQVVQGVTSLINLTVNGKHAPHVFSQRSGVSNIRHLADPLMAIAQVAIW